jgi:Flp pilus assembly protein TadD
MTMRPSILLIPALFLGAQLLAAQAPCAPPPSMKTQLQGTPNAAALNDLGVWFAGEKKYDCAANAFATSLQTDSDQKDVAHVAFMFGASLFLSGDAKEAIGALQEAEQLGYRNIKIHSLLAQAFEASHSTKDAENEWREALAFDPENSAALDALSDDLLQDNDFNATIALLETPRLLGQRTPKQTLNLASAYASAAKLDQAASVLRDGLNTSPDSLPVADQLAKVLVQLHRQDEAATVLELAVAQNPRDPDTTILYLETLMAAHPEKADENAARLLLAFPQNPKLLYLAGVLDMKGGNLTQARTHLEQSLALQPDEALTHEALGVVLAQLKDMTGAKEQFERAIALGDNSPELKANLAKVLTAIGPGNN